MNRKLIVIGVIGLLILLCNAMEEKAEKDIENLKKKLAKMAEVSHDLIGEEFIMKKSIKESSNYLKLNTEFGEAMDNVQTYMNSKLFPVVKNMNESNVDDVVKNFIEQLKKLRDSTTCNITSEQKKILDNGIQKLQKIINKDEAEATLHGSNKKKDKTTEEEATLHGSNKKKDKTTITLKKKSWFRRNWGWLMFGIVVVVVIGVSGFCIYYFQPIDNVPQIADESEYEYEINDPVGANIV